MKKKNKFIEFLNSKGFYTALFACMFAIVAIAAFVSIKNIDAISKLTTYGEADSSAINEQLEPAAAQMVTPISELAARRGEKADSPTDSPSNNTEKQPGESTKNKEINETQSGEKKNTETSTAPQTKLKEEVQQKNETKTEEKTEDTKVNTKEEKAQSSAAPEAQEAAAKKESNTDSLKPQTEQNKNEKPEAETKTDEKAETKTETQQSKPERENSNTSQITQITDGSEMSWPLDGAIVMDFSVSRAIYDKTLDQYRTNPTVSISADVGTQVKAAADGIVKSISIDPRTGYTVVIEHGNGWETVYGQLQDTILVTEGQTVTKGQAVGGVGEPTKYGVLLGSHLVFGINKDDVPQDPNVVLLEN